MSDKPKRPPFGWLILGLASGAVLGHWISFAFAIPVGYASEFAERLALIILACTFAGALVGVIFERDLQRLSLPYCWLAWFLVAASYFILFGFPIMQAARE